VDYPTVIYLYILRMADLLSLQPNLDIKLHLVAMATDRQVYRPGDQVHIFAAALDAAGQEAELGGELAGQLEADLELKPLTFGDITIEVSTPQGNTATVVCWRISWGDRRLRDASIIHCHRKADSLDSAQGFGALVRAAGRR
jgi:hypothetical protein